MDHHVCDVPPPGEQYRGGDAWFYCPCGRTWQINPIVGRWYLVVTP